MKIQKGITLLVSLFFFFSSLEGGVVQVDGKWSQEKYAPTLSLAEHYDLGSRLLAEEKWEEALQNFLTITIHFPKSPFYADSLFYSGVCYFYLEDHELANKQFDRYLSAGSHLKFFEKVFDYKCEIADAYATGAKKRPFGIDSLPRFMPAKGDALSLYEEIIATLPSREIAAKALYGKAKLLKKKKEFRESIETLQTLTRRFAKHSLAADAYLFISEIYLEQSALEAQNPDLLGLAQINLNRFLKSFPGDERIRNGEENLYKMKEIFASSLYETGRFYERKRKHHASKIYYAEAIKRYPDTKAAEKSRNKLATLEVKSDKIVSILSPKK